MIAAGFKSLIFASILIFSLAGSASPRTPAASCPLEQRLITEGDRLYHEGQFLLGAVSFAPLRFSSCGEPVRDHAWLGYANSIVSLDEAVEVDSVNQAIGDPSVANTTKAKLEMLWTYAKDQPHPLLTREQNLRWALWKARSTKQEFGQLLAQAANENDFVKSVTRLHDESLSAPSKSLFLAGFGSAILPGAGQAYTGHWQTAALAFVINAVFLGTTIEFYRHDQPWAGSASACVFSITYVGNIISAVQGAKNWNDQSRAPAEQGLKSVLLPELTF